MGALVINFGDPKSDGEFVVYGFSAGYFQGGKFFRRGNVLSCVRLPLEKGVKNLIKWEICVPEKQCIHFYFEGKEVCKAALDKPWTWEEISFEVTPEGDSSLYEIKIKCDNFVYEGRTEHCFFLSKVTIECEKNLQTYKGITQTKSLSLSILEKSQIFFGDIHIHSSFSPCGRERNGTPEENLEFAREVKKYDFASITDHSENLVSEKTWGKLCKILEKYNQDNVFVTLPGYEWTSDLYGHRNVYMEKPYERIFHCMEPLSSSPLKLWQSIREAKQNAITIPHHPIRAEFPMYWNDHDPELEPAVEISSMWGSSEYYGNPLQERDKSVTGTSVQDALMKGLKLGFVGGSDGHDRPPGTGGITAVFSTELTRKSVLEAIRKRRCYATTGEKIKLFVVVNNLLTMGDEIVVNQYQFEALYPLVFHITVEGTAPIEKIEILECNQVIYTYHALPPRPGFRSPRWKEEDFLKVNMRMDEFVGIEVTIPLWERWYYHYSPRERIWNIDPRVPNHSKFYYVRVTQKDGHMAWSSPIWIIFKPGECERIEI